MSYTCVSCGLVFDDADKQRSHMKLDWHRYNLKRRVASLPPIDEETFITKVSSLNVPDKPDQKTRKNSRTRKQDAHKQRHESSVVRKPTDRESEEDLLHEKVVIHEISETSNAQEVKKIDLPEQEASEEMIKQKLANRVQIPITTCLFCPRKLKMDFETIENNLAHMFKEHGLYIPEKKYLADRDGLINYLGEKLGLGNVCLVCSYQGKDLDSVRVHMMAKRHMRIPYESDEEKLEYADYYDFSSSYLTTPQITHNTSNDDGEWEDISGDDDDVDDDDNDDIPYDPIINTGTELLLPSGTTLGHRSLAKYYRQRPPPERVLTEGQGTVVAAETRHFAAEKQKAEFAMNKRIWSQQRKREDIDDRRAAKYINNQPYFRDQLLQ